jgi:hypothetical protein
MRRELTDGEDDLLFRRHGAALFLQRRGDLRRRRRSGFLRRASRQKRRTRNQNGTFHDGPPSSPKARPAPLGVKHQTVVQGSIRSLEDEVLFYRQPEQVESVSTPAALLCAPNFILFQRKIYLLFAVRVLNRRFTKRGGRQ